MSNNPYDLLEIKWNNELLMARPIEWSGDPSDEDGHVIAIKYEITCPSCGGRVEFYYNNMVFCECGSNAANPLTGLNEINEISENESNIENKDEPINEELIDEETHGRDFDEFINNIISDKEIDSIIEEIEEEKVDYYMLHDK